MWEEKYSLTILDSDLKQGKKKISKIETFRRDEKSDFPRRKKFEQKIDILIIIPCVIFDFG